MGTLKRNNPERLIPAPGFLRFILCVGLITLSSSGSDQPEPDADPDQIQVDQSRYWNYNGKKTLLLGAFNHGHNPFIDGSTLDTNAVDSMTVIIDQIQEMVEAGGNTLRCVLDPGQAASLGIDAFRNNPEGSYDLNHPVGPYWERLSVFIAEAEKKNVVVELEIWDRFDWYGINWEHSPFNPINNVNYTVQNSGLRTQFARSEIYRKHPFSKSIPGHPVYDASPAESKAQFDKVRKYQEMYVRKVLSCALIHHNVLYNVSNETAEHTAWGKYWIRFLKEEAAKVNRTIVCTDMRDNVFKVPDSKEFNYQLDHPGIYDYLDVSQVNSRHRDEVHWDKISWIADQAGSHGFLLHMTKVYGSDSAGIKNPWDGFKPGDSDNAIEEWWRNLIAGVAGLRFHRPHAGLGLNEKSKACIQATRKVESRVKFWDVDPRPDLLSDREEDEAYLAADPGMQYILYLTRNGGGSVGLNLSGYEGTRYTIDWVNIDTGRWGISSTIKGGGIIPIQRPDDSAHWAATIYSIE
jgi:hypothetical protein